MSINALGITLEGRDSIEFRASRSEEKAWVWLSVGGAQCEIRMERAHVEALRDQLPDVLIGLERFETADAARERAKAAGQRAADAAATALDKAWLAEQAGAHDVAASLRVAAVEAGATANAVDEAVRSFLEAGETADTAADKLIFASHQADVALGREPEAEPVEVFQ